MMFKKSYSNSMYSFSNSNFRLFTFFFSFICFFYLYFMFFLSTNQQNKISCIQNLNRFSNFYNNTYPLTRPDKAKYFIRYKIGLIADLDKQSKNFSKDYWISYMLKGYLIYYPISQKAEVKFEKNKYLLKNSLSFNKRGMELSELIVFNGKLFSCDDRTGVIYELIESIDENKNLKIDKKNKNNFLNESLTNSYKMIPWVILIDGDGKKEKPLKCEWLAVKDQNLYAGSFGKVWTNPQGKYINDDPQWIKKISVNGEITHLNWVNNFNKICDKVGIKFPGYLIHESVNWSNIKKKWFFLPRRASNSAYDEIEDEEKGTNLMIIADENFNHIDFKTVGPLNQKLGFSSFKFLPNFDDEIVVALKSKEFKNKSATYITIFNMNGNIILTETLVDDSIKFEGIEFI